MSTRIMILAIIAMIVLVVVVGFLVFETATTGLITSRLWSDQVEPDYKTDSCNNLCNQKCEGLEGQLFLECFDDCFRLDCEIE